MNEEKDIKLNFLIISSILLIAGSLLLFYGLNQKDQILQPSESEVRVSPFPKVTEEANNINGTEAIVKKVIDGDTIELSSGEKVRYIGIDTPETVDPRRAVGCFGKEASDENKKLVEGKTIMLVKDISEKDKFDRLLRLVYLKQNNGNLIFVNDFLIRQGFAKASTYPPDVKFSAQFVEAEKEARDSSRGLWKMCI